jgi:hypothetical protein
VTGCYPFWDYDHIHKHTVITRCRTLISIDLKCFEPEGPWLAFLNNILLQKMEDGLPYPPMNARNICPRPPALLLPYDSYPLTHEGENHILLPHQQPKCLLELPLGGRLVLQRTLQAASQAANAGSVTNTLFEKYKTDVQCQVLQLMHQADVCHGRLTRVGRQVSVNQDTLGSPELVSTECTKSLKG